MNTKELNIKDLRPFDISEVKEGDEVVCVSSAGVVTPQKIIIITDCCLVTEDIEDPAFKHTYWSSGVLMNNVSWKLHLPPKPQPQIPADPPKGWQVLTDEALENPDEWEFINRDGDMQEFIRLDEQGEPWWRDDYGNSATNIKGLCEDESDFDVFCRRKARSWKKFVNIHPDGGICTTHNTKEDAERCSVNECIDIAVPVTVTERREKK